MTIKQRRMALIVASTLVIVGLLTWFFTSHQISVMESDLRGDAARTRLLWIGFVTGGIALLGAVVMAWFVAERTKALEACNQEMRLVFDHIDQGLLVVDLDGVIAPDHAAAVETWLGAVPPSRRIVDFVRGFAPARADWFAVMWDSLKNDLLPLELAVTQLPDGFDVAGRHLTWSYKPFETAGARRILIVVSDVSAQLARERDERDERETTALLTRALRDGAGFAEACAETSRLVNAIECVAAAPTELALAIHTLKGVAGLLQLPSIAGACHTLETGITDEDREAIAIQRAAIARRWAELARRAAPYLDGEHGRLPVYEPDVLALETAIARGATGGELTLLVAGWRDERASDRLQRIAEQAQALAQRLGKAPVVVAIDCDPELRFPAELAPMWSAFVHGLRNAIDHGIEEPAIRAAAGKLAVATLSLRAAVEGEDLVIELADDGRGIDWDRVAEVARARGLPADTAPDLEAALFHAGLSTRAEVTETSGRGIGMAALRAVIDELGAHLTLSSSRGRGTRLRVVWRRRLPTSSRRRYPSSNPIAYPIDPSTTLQTGRP